MKYIARISILLVLIMSVLLGLSLVFINNEQPESIDTVFINEVYNGIMQGEFIKGKYDYTYINSQGKVLYSSVQAKQLSYAGWLNQALKNGYAVKEVGDNRIIFYTTSNDYKLQYKRNLTTIIVVCYAIILLVMVVYCIYLYYRIIHPFDRLNNFAKQVAKGDLETPLAISRFNNFGAFEEAFDIMRFNIVSEQKRAEQIEMSKKQLLAEIGHDIKTPLMSIRAISEYNLLKNDDKGYRIILDKTNKIDRLISEIYQTTLEEMGELNVLVGSHNIDEVYAIISNSDYNGYVNMKNKLKGTNVLFDGFRLAQVVENIIVNSYKYANTEIDVECFDRGDKIDIEFKDYGTGVSEEELSHIMDKFYRGEKVRESNGQGLGLYISRKLMNKMQGDLSVSNDDGLKVVISLMKTI